jgi:hypothetical protein
MYRKSISGQFVYFAMANTASGLPIVSGGTGISGRRCVDGGAMSLVSGTFTDDGGGLYHLNAYDWDMSGNNIGFLFTHANSVPISFNVVTTAADPTNSGTFGIGALQSGRIQIASGPFVVATTTIASGSLYLASGSEINIASGSRVLLYSGSLSGFQINLNSGSLVGVHSGTFVNVFSGSLSGIIIASGALVEVLSGTKVNIFSGGFVVATVSVASGELYLASGSIFRETFASGVIAASGGLSTSWGNSGAVTLGQNLDKTGYTVLSGTTFIASGPFVVASVSVASGELYLASGSIFRNTFASGVLAGSGGLATSWGNSGAVTVGQNLDKDGYTVLSGTTQIASGAFVIASVLSGSVYLASGSIFRFTFASGVLAASGGIATAWGNSGSVVTAVNFDKTDYTVLSGTTQIASGPFVVATASVASGEIYLASGSIFMTTFASGVVGGGSGNLPSSWGNSGAVTVGQNLDKTGYTVLSGTTQIASGAFVVASVSIASGELYLASGSIFRNTFASGVLAASGGIATAWGNSGTVVTSLNFDKSGYTANTLSGTTQIASGPFVVATASVASGEIYLASGSIFRFTFASGVLAASGGLSTAWGNSGAVTVGQNLDKDGYTVLSGTTFIASGAFVVATVSVSSGDLYLASGSIFRNTFASGVLAASGGLPTSWGNSGAVTVGQNLDKSGYTADILSGTTQIASGAFVVTTLASGTVFLASGHQINLYSGNLVGTYSGTTFIASGAFVVASVSIASGTTFLASGSQVNLLSGNIVQLYSGQTVILYSGQSVISTTILDKSGYSLLGTGLDLIQVESGMNMRQAQSVIAAATGGRLSGAGTGTIRIDGANVSGTNRIAAVVDQSGNRTSVIVTLP